MVIATEQQGFLAAWQYRDYRLLWVCTLGIYVGHWIEAVVVSWLVLELTDSPFLVGVLGACRFAAMFLGPFFGTMSGRYDRRHILITVQLTLTAASLIMMGLVLTSRLLYAVYCWCRRHPDYRTHRDLGNAITSPEWNHRADPIAHGL
jgi:MFS family permease